MKRLMSLVLFITILASCASNIVEPKKGLCNFDSLQELAGSYKNLGFGKLNGREVYLSEVLMMTKTSESQFLHSDIETISVNILEGKVIASAEAFGGAKYNINTLGNAKVQNRVINLYDNTDFLPDPSGGVVVGPQRVQINLNQDCDGNLLFHKMEKVTGLIFLLLPVKSELNSYVVFSRE